MTEYPRLLVVAPNPLGWGSGGGVTMCNLLKGWPSDRIAQIHSGNVQTADMTICSNHYYLAGCDMSLPGLTLIGLAKFFMRYLVAGQSPLWHFNSMSEVEGFVQRFAPDVIYAYVLQSPPAYWILPRLLSMKFRIPYVTHIMDDWPAMLEGIDNNGNRFLRKPMRRWALRLLFGSSEQNLGICDKMCVAFSKRYGTSFIPFHNCVETDSWPFNDSFSYSFDRAFDMVYIGSLLRRKELASLIDLRRSISDVSNSGANINLTIYHPKRGEDARNYDEYFAPFPFINKGEYLSPHELPARLAKADALALTINFEGVSRTYLRYSFQTKVPEYMASGRPILVYGPPDHCNVESARFEGWGLTVEQRRQNDLTDAIKTIIGSESLRRRIGRQARLLAEKQHDVRSVRQRFRNMLFNTVCRKI